MRTLDDIGGGCQRVISSMKKRFRITDNGQLYELPGELVMEERGVVDCTGCGWQILYNHSGMCVPAHG